MPDRFQHIGSLVTAISAKLPLAAKDDLAVLADVVGNLELISNEAEAPAALKSQAARTAKLAERIIMAETPFENGLKKLEQSIAKMADALARNNAAENDWPIRETVDNESAPDSLNIAAQSEISSVPEDLRELRAKFAAQQKSVLDDFEAGVLECEKNAPQSRGAIKRMLHTWKGEFGVLDLQQYSKLIHEAEAALADGSLTVDGLFKLKDLLQNKMEELANGLTPGISETERRSIFSSPGKLSHDDSPECEGDGADESRFSVCGDGAAEETKTGTEGVGSTLPDAQTLHAEPALVADFICESREHIHVAETLLLELETNPSNMECVNGVFRSCHTIKGVAGFLGLQSVSELAHSTENLMDRARKGELQLESYHIDMLLEAMDCLKHIIGAIEHTEHGGTFAYPSTYHEIMHKLSVRHDAAPGFEIEPAESPNKKTGEILVERGVVGAGAVQSAIARQEAGDTRKLGEILIEENAASTRSVAGALASQNAARQAKAVEETIRVPVGRLDALVDAIGEAVIAHSMVAAGCASVLSGHTELEKKVSRTSTIMRGIQELSMSLRMVSIKATFQKMARLVRDLSKKSGKEIDFITQGEETELDKSVVDNIADPLIHILRNAVDHGIEESARERVQAGKPARARVILRAFHRGGNINVEVEDDGRGLDKEAILAKAVKQGLCGENDKLAEKEIYRFIFAPGFSTAKKITDVSGRGVGMDVVRRNVQALRGSTEIESEPGRGTTISIRLPLTLAIIDGMIVRLGAEKYILPTLSILESLRPESGRIETVLNKGEMIRVRGNLIKIIRLSSLFGHNGRCSKSGDEIAMIVEDMLGRRAAFMVDEILGQQQVVIKNLGDGMGDVPGVSGGAIMSDGTVSLILDISGLMKVAEEKARA